MTQRFPPPPANTVPLRAARPSQDARNTLALRRSASKRHLCEPGPSATELDEILRVAMRVPDHRKLEPWRFIVFEGDARTRFGKTLAEIYDRQTPDATASDILEEAGRFERAPVVIAVISSPCVTHKTPVWEQELSVGAVCHNLLLAANASGWAGVWLTEWLAFDKDVDAALGLTADERIAGYIYLGTASANNPERPRPNTSYKITRWA